MRHGSHSIEMCLGLPDQASEERGAALAEEAGGAERAS